MNKYLERQAAVLNYERIYFSSDWEIEFPISARKIFQNAAHLARAEGNLLHAASLEARLPKLPENSRYRVGRLKNGCATAYVVGGK